MVANIVPIFPLTPKVSWATLSTTANTAMTGAGTVDTDIWLVFTAGANGARVDEIRIKALGTNTITALRIFVNNGATNGTVTNNALIYDKTIPATTASNTTELAELVITPDNLVLPATYRLYAAVGSVAATFTGLKVTVIGGDY